MDINDLIKKGNQISLNIGLDDLKEFARTFAVEIKDELKPKEPKLYTRSEILEMLNVCDATLWSYEKNGIIKGKKIGNRKYYPESEVEKLMK